MTFRRFRWSPRWTIAVLTFVFGQWNFAAMVHSQDPKKAHTNRLVDQTSPYLLQHSHNPVNWFPWGDEAFARAKRENKPVFLSIGYSTCYWCHVMEVESFEDEEVAAVINELFVAIKVDREEHPDIDEQYMLATQLITKRGGWPNSVWLTPEGKPWMAGTYFPKQGFIQVLRQLADAWKNRRPEVDQQAEEIANATQRMGSPVLVERIELSPKLNQHATDQLIARFDKIRGGFGGAPKFPPHGTLQLLIQQYRVTENELLVEPITATLDAMWLGGIHDHIGGGFHRYSTDNEWLLPHFEKMLYDNAQLMRAYVDGYKITEEKRYRDAVADINGWVQREMTSSAGAFFSALDSGEVGKEGEAYVWRLSRLTENLGSKDAALFASIYGFEKDGNYKEQASGKKNQTNIPHLKQPIETIAEQLKESEPELQKRLVHMRAKLLADRQTWPQPRIDDKVLTSWNGLMIGSLAHAGRVLNEPKYIESASRAADFILNNMTRDGVLLRTYRNDIAKINGYLDDYAYFVQGLLELYHATDDSRWLDQAIHFANAMIHKFQDQANGGFFFTSGAHDELIARSKHLSGGGNMPDPNGIAAQVLLELAKLTNHPDYLKSAKRTLESLSGLMAGQPHGQEHLLVATSQFLAMKKPRTEDSFLGEQIKRVEPVTMRVGASRLTAHPGSTITIKVLMDIDDGWHLYAENPTSEFLVPSRVTVEANEQVEIGKMKSPSPESTTDPILKQRIDIYAGRVEFEVPLSISPKAMLGKIPVTIIVKTQACDKNRCLPPQSTKFELTLQIFAPTSPDKALDR